MSFEAAVILVKIQADEYMLLFHLKLIYAMTPSFTGPAANSSQIYRDI